MLCRVDPRFQWSCPTCRVDGSALVILALDRLPVDEECNRILGLRDTVVWLAGSNSSCSTCDDTGWNGEIL